jgi:hypothetical protein
VPVLSAITTAVWHSDMVPSSRAHRTLKDDQLVASSRHRGLLGVQVRVRHRAGTDTGVAFAVESRTVVPVVPLTYMRCTTGAAKLFDDPTSKVPAKARSVAAGTRAEANFAVGQSK